MEEEDSILPRSILRTYFETGDIPTQAEFWSVLDSYVHKLDDGVTIYKPSPAEIFFGINNLTPQAPLGIKGMDDDDSIAAFNHSDSDTATWFINLNPAGTKAKGFNIDEALVSGKTSRFFIQESDGAIGLGTTEPTQQLHIEASAGTDVTGIHILNTATLVNQGFGIGHEANADEGLNGSFTIFENNFSQANKRMVIKAGGNVGINELLPDTKLHVSRLLSDPKTDLDLIEGTGIVTIGPITDNVVGDYRGFQARHGEYVGTDLDITAATLNLQRLGGDLLIHGDDTIDVTSKGIITNDGNLGLGTITPLERIDIDGAIKLGTTDSTNEGTIRYSGTDLEGYIGGAWLSLTSEGSSGPWVEEDNDIYYIGKSKTRVGIGTKTPNTTLDINEKGKVETGSIAVTVYNHTTTASSSPDDARVGMEIKSDGEWQNGYNIGLYTSAIVGNKNPEKNFAAVLNGNVVIGDIAKGSKFSMRSKSQRVLAIEVGTAPLPGGDMDNIAIYAKYSGVTSLPVFTVMNGNNDVVQLYKEAGLTEEDDSVISETEYGPTEAAVIERLRTRIDELEARLMAFGLLAEPVPPAPIP